MNQLEKDIPKKSYRGDLSGNQNNKSTGIILLIIGVGVMLKNLDTNLPDWLFRWEVGLILLGIIVGIRSKFRSTVWFIMIAIGGVSLLDLIFPQFLRPQFTWAVISIAVGLFFIFRPKGNKKENWLSCGVKKEVIDEDDPTVYTGQDVLDVTAIFGGVKKIVVSKNFRGGEITSVMGGSEIDLSQADIKGRVKLEATNIMGGTKLIIPPTWDVRSEIVAIFGGVEDKRDVHSLKIDTEKILILEGTCIFGGLEIKSF